jgi:acetolactate synthase I/II/III large subunit
MRVADYLANYIAKLGVKNVFMLSGTGSIHLDDAFAFQKDINHICARHEAAAVYMAEAAAKLTGKIGVVIATTGPGGTNAISGVVEAWVDSTPVLVISGQVNANQISKGVRSFGVQGFNIIENVQHITKYAVQITDPYSIKFHLEKAIYEAYSGRPGPVWLDIPLDIQAQIINPNELESFNIESKPEITSEIKVKETLSLIKDADKPLIIFGQGVRSSGAIDEFENFLENFQIPAICSRMSFDILPYENQYYFGMGGMRGHKAASILMKEANVILILGSSFTHAYAGNSYDFYNQDAKLIMVNVDNSESTKPGLKLDATLNIDVKQFLQTANKLFKKNEFNFPNWLSRCRYLHKNVLTVDDSMAKNPINSYYFIECLNKVSKENHIFVNDAGSSNYICSQALKLKKGQRELTSGAFYSMGIALPLAIGAGATEKGAQVIAITGDGSIELNIQELRTLSQNNLDVKLFIINNGGYASIRKSQDELVGGGRYTDDEEVLNFENVAKAFELEFEILDNHETLEADLATILSKSGPVLIEVVCDSKQEIIEPFNLNYLLDQKNDHKSD